MLFRLVLSVILLSAVAFAEDSTQTTKDRIIGGKPAKITDYPWQVSLSQKGRHFCGGSIIDRYKILTAAHCLYRRAQQNPDYLQHILVRVGSANRLSGGFLRTIKKAIWHESYNRTTGDHDIAILMLTVPLIFTFKIQPIVLPRQNETVAVNETVLVSGWGTQNHGAHDLPVALHSVAVHIIDQDSCARAYASNSTSSRNIVTGNMVCAGIWNIGGKDSCQGDSGGPLAAVTEDKAILHGIVSWGYSCALPTHPGVYTRVARYFNWILSVF